VIIVPTPSPLVPLPLLKGKGEVFIKRGAKPLLDSLLLLGDLPLLNSLLLGFAPLNFYFASLYFIRGRGINKRGGFAPSLQLFPPLLEKERGI
jgi:hypothetical protein